MYVLRIKIILQDAAGDLLACYAVYYTTQEKKIL